MEGFGSEPCAARVWDVEGCYPSMPKEIILSAMKDILKEIVSSLDPSEHRTRPQGVSVPKHSSRVSPYDGHWGPAYTKDRIHLTWNDLLLGIQFSLDNCFLLLPSGVIQQTSGIPMGDPLSPPMAIATCAWLERRCFRGFSFCF